MSKDCNFKENMKNCLFNDVSVMCDPFRGNFCFYRFYDVGRGAIQVSLCVV